MRIVYFDCSAGVAGDMVLGALVDAGADVGEVRSALEALEVPGWRLEFQEVMRGGLRAMHAEVHTDEQHRHRKLADIVSVIDTATLDERVAELATTIFTTLADAEARVHGTSIDEVHFHEVGAVDAIVDVVGCSAALVSLDADEVVCSPLALGSGTASTMHGTIPVPVPAVLEMVRGKPVEMGGDGERATPTGVAIMVAAATRFGSMPALTLEAVGHGAGSRDTPDRPNVVRVFVGEGAGEQTETEHLLLETNIDDMSPELVPYAIERLLASGARDAWVAPITMKKGRPAFMMSVLTPQDRLPQILEALYAETTTLGVRIRPTGKHELEREWETVQVEGYDVRLKIGKLGGREMNVAPEYEDAAKVARITGMSLKEVYRRALQERSTGD